MRRFLLPLILLLASCQPIPHPFAEDTPAPGSPSLSPPDSAGILITPVAGAPSPLATQLAAAMAQALRDADVPASTEGGNKQSFRLSGICEERSLAPGRSAITINWVLTDAKGRQLAKRAQVVKESSSVWHAGGDELARSLVQDTAPGIAKLIEGEIAAPTAPPELLVAVLPVTGAPGDGSRALARAMGEALEHAHFTIEAQRDGHENYAVAGAVTVAAPVKGQQRVQVHWQVLRRDGSEVGRVDQDNQVPAGSLDKSWSDTAFAVVAAAAHDVAGLIEGARAADVGGARPAIHAPLIAVLPVAGATGDGARSLALAMADALKRAHLAVTLERNGHEGFVVAGQVKISLPESGKQRVQVSWRVLRADGGELGHVDQDNKVIAGSLDGAWNDTALAVAGAAVNSITALIARGNGHGS